MVRGRLPASLCLVPGSKRSSWCALRLRVVRTTLRQNKDAARVGTKFHPNLGRQSRGRLTGENPSIIFRWRRLRLSGSISRPVSNREGNLFGT